MSRIGFDVPPEFIDEIAQRVADLLSSNISSRPLLTVEEAADVLRCKPKRVYDLCSQRRISYVKDGSRTLIRRAALDDYLEAHQQ